MKCPICGEELQIINEYYGDRESMGEREMQCEACGFNITIYEDSSCEFNLGDVDLHYYDVIQKYVYLDFGEDKIDILGIEESFLVNLDLNKLASNNFEDVSDLEYIEVSGNKHYLSEMKNVTNLQSDKKYEREWEELEWNWQ